MNLAASQSMKHAASQPMKLGANRSLRHVPREESQAT
jgi:hypothetical protein